jgi:Fe-S-cluster containining protein
MPGIWRYMLPEDFQYMRFPNECEATCDNCPKVKTDGFLEDTKCCTYLPRMPNFLMGLGLGDKATKPVYEKLLLDGFLLPEGMYYTPIQMVDSLNQHVQDKFGRSDLVICPFLNRKSGMCGAYSYRNSVCGTFFCINEQGREGEAFWERVQSLVGQIETALGQWCMVQLGFDVEEYFKLVNSHSDKIDSITDSSSKSWAPEFREALWGHWFGKEQEFFLESAQLIAKNKQNLYEIADGVKILQPTELDLALRKWLPQELRAELDHQGQIAGEPVPPSDLWYQLQLAHRNLWQPT